MSVSGRKSKMTKGRLDGAVVQFTQTEWTEDESKNGKDIVNFSTVFVDADGQEYPRKFYLGDQKYVHVNGDGGIDSVDESRQYTISMDMAAGKILASLEDAGFSGKKLDAVGDTPNVVDGQWVRLKEVSSGSMKNDGVTPFTDLLVDELVDAPSAKAAGKKSSSASTTASRKKTAAPVVEEDEEEEKEAVEDESDDESDDPIRAAAVDAMEKILTSLSTKTPLVKNFDSEAANGGITIKQAYTASFGVLKGKDVKGPGSNMINDPAFHLENAAEGLYKFSKKTGVITPVD